MTRRVVGSELASRPHGEACTPNLGLIALNESDTDSFAADPPSTWARSMLPSRTGRKVDLDDEAVRAFAAKQAAVAPLAA